MSVTTPRGQVLRDHEGLRLEFVRTYDSPIGEVWAALTEPVRVARWIGEVTGDPVTGTVQFLMTEDTDGVPTNVQILECDPPRRLVIDTPTPDGNWLLTMQLAVTESGTQLVFTHRMAEPYDATSVGPGWHFYLDRLGAVIAGGAPDAAWEDYYPSLQSDYPLPHEEA